ncbi:hypothetical protein [Fodinicola feengrottensis]|uniref:Beta/gamma crystallin 'Greek key' domain-containing protein n=1 Tax=Fodinicola feengrottensis TaxID=435914 RepID=A0ABP4UIB8_9ACTN|nr:hypothetical protein [Fodinicola feengrottensis]
MFTAKTLTFVAVAAAVVLGITGPASAAPPTLQEVRCIGASDGFLHFHQIPGDRCFAYAGDIQLYNGNGYFPVDAYDSGNNSGWFVYKAPGCSACREWFPKHHYQYFNPSIDIFSLHIS